MFYKEAKDGQILQEGINEAGGMADWIAAATSYSNNNVPMLPVYIFYSMFGIQRIGDLCWAAGDMRAGLLVGGTAGRTTLNGEGLQHEDGHSHVWFSSIPNVRTYDPTFQYEVAIITQHAVKRMLDEQHDEYYYLTVMNENYVHPDMPAGAGGRHHQGDVPVQGRRQGEEEGMRVQLTGSGTILREVIAAADLLRNDWGVESDLWSAPASTNCGATASTASAGICCTRWMNRASRTSPNASCPRAGPVVAATDYMRIYADSVRPASRRPLRCSAPTALAVRTVARTCAASLR